MNYFREPKFLQQLKVVFTVLIFVTFFNISAKAQEKQRSWVARINAGTFLSITNVSIEKAFLKRHSLSLIPSFGYLRSEQATYKTYGIGAEYRYYFTRHNSAPNSFYGGLGWSFDNGKATIETNNNEVTDVLGYTIDIIGGKQWILKKGWAIDAKIGFQYIRLNYKNVRADGDFTLPAPAVGVGFGYSF